MNQPDSETGHKRAVILGQGAIGSLIAAKAFTAKMDFAVQTKSGAPIEITYSHHAQQNSWRFLPASCEQLKAQDVLIVPLKAYEVIPALAALPLPQTTAIVLLHNGMGTIEQVKQQYPSNPLLAATTSYGALKQDKNSLRETGQGKTAIGWINQAAPQLQDYLTHFFSATLGPLSWEPDIQLALWYKLAVNAVINPLTALHQIHNGELQQAQYRQIIQALCEEIALVMQQQGYATTAKALEQNVKQVYTATAANYSSMNRDVANQRQTEIDFINGYVVQQAQQLGLNTPVNHQLWQQIKQLSHAN